MTVTQAKKLDKDQALAEAIRVINLEADALKKLSGSLDDSFVDLVNAIIKVKGRVIISGIGKSGHVAKKIAATLASTGTPAFSIHPSEASHGDLGMIAADDFVVLLSNSGETAELSDLITYTRRYKIPLCGITFNEASTLVKYANQPICLPRVSEACPLGLAPTTTTTMMMAFGDALSVSLLKARGFTSDNFKQFHPGGKLGQRLLKVSDVMNKSDDIPLVQSDASAADVILEMTQKRHGCTGVLNKEGHLIGMITDGDLRRHMSEDFLKSTAADLASPNPVTVPHDWLAIEALGYMNDTKITKVFVVDKKADARAPVGLLNIHTCLSLGLV
ncbi:KpsF/GutQ family sugar-phosphate isomerase [Alphaproteobacteria bacterium]|nr:KpsF/GutQ family sugar-phosphate isomerase [Alphaproteobacteria bacterium]